MIHRWDRPGVPHLGWALVGAEDIGAAEHVCEMCGREEIRYVHEVAHPEHENLLVGCVCAERMTGDPQGPKRAEQGLRNRARRRRRWVAGPWCRSRAGNDYRKVPGVVGVVGVCPDPRRSGAWKWWIGNEFSRRPYATPAHARSALFDALLSRGKLKSRT